MAKVLLIFLWKESLILHCLVLISLIMRHLAVSLSRATMWTWYRLTTSVNYDVVELLLMCCQGIHRRPLLCCFDLTWVTYTITHVWHSSVSDSVTVISIWHCRNRRLHINKFYSICQSAKSNVAVHLNYLVTGGGLVEAAEESCRCSRSSRVIKSVRRVMPHVV